MTVSHLFSYKMAVKMVLFWVSLVLAIIGSNASGEFSVLYSPPSLKFTGRYETLESFLKEIYSASLGLSVEENSQWNGLSITDPFSTPEAVVEVYIDGVVSLAGDGNLKSKNFPLKVDEYEPDAFEALKSRIQHHYKNTGNILAEVDLSDFDKALSHDIFRNGGDAPPKVMKQVLQHLKYNVEEDFQFLTELETLKAVTERISYIKPDNVIDFYEFRFRSLHALSDFHGPNSLQTKEAKMLLGHALEGLTAAFRKAYDGSVLVAVVTTDVAHTRRTIRSVEAKPRQEDDDLNPAPEDFAAMFNIFLWVSVVLAFSLVAIVYALMDMDPGRDSIIYRMTSTRMKKDN